MDDPCKYFTLKHKATFSSWMNERIVLSWVQFYLTLVVSGDLYYLITVVFNVIYYLITIVSSVLYYLTKVASGVLYYLTAVVSGGLDTVVFDVLKHFIIKNNAFCVFKML